MTTPSRACLLPKLRHHFAEFLNKSSSNRLRILIPSTCVGLGYGLIYISLRSFSWKHRITNFVQSTRHHVSGYMCCGFAYNTPYSLKPGQPTPGSATFLRHSFSQTIYTKHGNINPLSIAYAFQPRLRYRLTLGGVTWPRNPWIFGGRDSRPPYRYLCHHQLLWDLQRSLRYAFIGKHNALLPSTKYFHSFGTYLKPRYILGAEPLVQ